jgi:lysophospholipase L1-like esterase
MSLLYGAKFTLTSAAMAFIPGPDRLACTRSSLRAFLRWYVELHPPFFRAFVWRCVEGFPGFVRERLPRFLRASGRRFVEWLPALAISLVCIEIVLQAGVRLGVANVDLPSYSIAYAKPFWQDINPHFGVWHPAHARYRHQRACFDLVYASNAHGMRDREVEITSPSPRVVVVGDSFAEGWGAAYGRRFTEHLHQRTGIEHLNFGTSGDFGSTQSYLLYKTFAARFDHRAVIFTILPENDFLDDTPTPWRLVKGARHRPYLVGTYPDYELQYPAGKWSGDKRWGWHFKNLLREFWLTFRVLDHGVQTVQRIIAFETKKHTFDPMRSYYFDYTPEEFDRLRYAIEQIKALAGERPMLIVTIPFQTDFPRTAASADPPPLRRDLSALAARLGITYMDLLEHMNEERAKYFLGCDPHWSEAGHELVANVIARWSFYRR